MAVITALQQSDLDALLSRYDLGTLSRYWPASNGIENTNYFIRLNTPRGERDYVATILEQTVCSGRLLVPLLDLCDKTGLPVAPTLRNVHGKPTDEICGKPVLISPRLPGRHVFNPTSGQCAAIGRFLARFHIAGSALNESAEDHPRNAQWLREMSALADHYIPFSDHQLMEDAICSIASMLERHDVKNLPRGIIHGDLFRDNALFTERGLSGVLDFHHAARGYWIYDIAVAANDWCNDTGGVMDPDRTMALIRAYHAIRPLSREEVWFFPVFTLYAAMAFWLSRLTVALRARDASNIPFNNPEEFQHIVAQHVSHFFYLDYRLLENGGSD